MNNCIAVILAGGKGSRLEPLTLDRAKPAVPFGGAYRIIDFSLSNCLNSGLSRILMLTQYKAVSLGQHVNRAWRSFFRENMNEYVHLIAPQHRISEDWYQGTADAVFQNIYSIEKENPEYVIVLSGDHVYKMDYRPMVEFHKVNGADLTIGAMPVSLPDAGNLGVIQVDGHNQVSGFEEKPVHPKPIPGNENECLASMGIYIFSAKFLFEKLCQDAANAASTHDFGRDIIPSSIETNRIFAFPFEDVPARKAYWRDVGTLDSYFRANMDLLQSDSALDLNERNWPIRTHRPDLPPARLMSTTDGNTRPTEATDCIVCSGAILCGATVRNSIVGANVRIEPGAIVEDSILLNGVSIGRNARIKRAIVDKHVRIPANTAVGWNHENDLTNGHTVTRENVVVVARGVTDESVELNRRSKPRRIPMK